MRTAYFKAWEPGRDRQGRGLDGDADIADEGCEQVCQWI
jgi:hypothetical protein